jgi:hypothetical protein
LLKGSSDHTRGLWADHPTLLFGLAPGGVCQAFAITGEPVSSYLAFSTLPTAKAAGGMFSVVLSPDHSGPPLTATPSYGVRTFLPSRLCARSDRSIHFSLQWNVWPRRRYLHWPIDLPICPTRGAHDNTIGIKLAQPSHRALKRHFELCDLDRIFGVQIAEQELESLCRRISFCPNRRSQTSLAFRDILGYAAGRSLSSPCRFHPKSPPQHGIGDYCAMPHRPSPDILIAIQP